jgi:hypothetical protein
LLGAWTTVDTQIEVVGTEPVAGISRVDVVKEDETDVEASPEPATQP